MVARGRICTYDLQVMSLASYYCSTPQCLVEDKRLELLNLSMLAPKASVFANFTNLPCTYILYNN